MQKVIAFMHTTLDGFACGPQGELEWASLEPAVADDVDARLREVGTVIYGRITYGMMAGYWPTVPANPASTPREVKHARWVEEIPKLVISRSLEHADWHHTTLIRDDVAAQVNAEKQKPGGPLMVFGSPRLVHVLARLGLIDEYLLYLNPVTLGGGTPLFEPGQPTGMLKLLESKTFAAGVTMLRYATSGAVAPGGQP